MREFRVCFHKRLKAILDTVITSGKSSSRAWIIISAMISVCVELEHCKRGSWDTKILRANTRLWLNKNCRRNCRKQQCTMASKVLQCAGFRVCLSYNKHSTCPQCCSSSSLLHERVLSVWAEVKLPFRMFPMAMGRCMRQFQTRPTFTVSCVIIASRFIEVRTFSQSPLSFQLAPGFDEHNHFPLVVFRHGPGISEYAYGLKASITVSCKNGSMVFRCVSKQTKRLHSFLTVATRLMTASTLILTRAHG